MAVIDPLQIAALEEAQRMLGEQDPALSCRVRARLATALQPADDPSGPTALALQALAEARATGDSGAILDVLDLGGLGAYYTPVADRIAWASELRDRALAAAGPRQGTDRADLAVVVARRGGRLLRATRRRSSQALELSGRVGHPRLRWGPLLLAAGGPSRSGTSPRPSGTPPR